MKYNNDFEFADCREAMFRFDNRCHRNSLAVELVFGLHKFYPQTIKFLEVPVFQTGVRVCPLLPFQCFQILLKSYHSLSLPVAPLHLSGVIALLGVNWLKWKKKEKECVDYDNFHPEWTWHVFKKEFCFPRISQMTKSSLWSNKDSSLSQDE